MNLTVKKYDNWSTFAKVMVTIKVTYFWDTGEGGIGALHPVQL